MFKLEIATDNAAFEGHPGHELARILHKLADHLDDGTSADGTRKLYDVNGNHVGSYTLTE